MTVPGKAFFKISEITSPLAFFVLTLCVFDGTLGGLAYSLENYRGELVWTIILSLPGFLMLVVSLAIWQPGVLYGIRPLDGLHAQKFANDLFRSIDGTLSNLSDADRSEAWANLAAEIVPTEYDGVDRVYTGFCTAVATRITKITGDKARTRKPRGRVAK